MRKRNLTALIGASALVVGVKLASADTPLFVTQADWGGSSYGLPAGSQTGYQGMGLYNSSSTAVTNGDKLSDTLAYPASTLGGQSFTSNGLANFDNFNPATGSGKSPDANLGTSWAGKPSATGSLVVTNWTGGYDIISSGEMIVPAGSGSSVQSPASAAFINALTTGTCMAFDITVPGGGTTIPTTFYQTSFETADPNISPEQTNVAGFNNRGFMQSDSSATLAAKSTNLSGPSTNYSVGNDDPGTFTIVNGTGASSYWTVYLPYSVFGHNGVGTSPSNGYYTSAAQYASTLTYLQFQLEINSGGFASSAITIDDVHTVSPTWAASGNGSWTTEGQVNYNDAQPGGGIPSNGVLTQQGNWVGAGANSLGQYGYGVPSGSGVSATFSDLETANATVTLDAPQTVGTLNFNTLNYQYILSKGTAGQLIMDNTANATATTAFINVVAAGTSATNYTEIISAPVQLNETTAVSVTRSTDVLSISGNIGGTGGLSMSGAGTLQLSGSNSYSGGTSVSSGTLQATTASALPLNQSVTVSGGLLELTSAIAGTGNISLNGVTISGGKLQLDTNSTAGSQPLNPPPASNVNITSLSISGAGTLDINNNHVIIDYTAGNDPISSIAAWIKSGANVTAGVATWTGTGITSTAAVANAKSYGIGYADAADPGNPAHLAPGQIEVMYTLLGDANLDGKVNGTDFNILAANFNTGGDSWDQGDFTYDGKVNGSDFNLLAQNFNQGATQAADMAALQALEVAYGFTSPISVPEPASAGLLVLGTIGVMSRRRRSAKA